MQLLLRCFPQRQFDFAGTDEPAPPYQGKGVSVSQVGGKSRRSVGADASCGNPPLPGARS